MTSSQELLLTANSNPLVEGVFFYRSKFVNDVIEEVLPVYSGHDVGFYDSPSGITVLPDSKVTFGSGPSIFGVPSVTQDTREIPWWEKYWVIATLAIPALRISRFPYVLFHPFQEITDWFLAENPQYDQDLPV